MYLGDNNIFFQLIGRYSVSSGDVSFLWLIAFISMSPSRFLNPNIAMVSGVRRVSERRPDNRDVF
jgi:hypothetical protein